MDTSSTDCDFLYWISCIYVPAEYREVAITTAKCRGHLWNTTLHSRENNHNVIDSQTRNTTRNYWRRNKQKLIITSPTVQLTIWLTPLTATTPWRQQFHQLLLHMKPRSPAGLGCTHNVTLDHLVDKMPVETQHKAVLSCTVQCMGRGTLESCARIIMVQHTDILMVSIDDDDNDDDDDDNAIWYDLTCTSNDSVT